jgi:hypothetical protein
MQTTKLQDAVRTLCCYERLHEIRYDLRVQALGGGDDTQLFSWAVVFAELQEHVAAQ